MADDPGDDESNRIARASEAMMNRLISPYEKIISDWMMAEWELFDAGMLRCSPCPMMIESLALWLLWKIKEDMVNGPPNHH